MIFKAIFKFYKWILKNIYSLVKNSNQSVIQSKVIPYEKRKEIFNDLTSTEYKQLIVFNKLNEYEKLSTNSKIKNYSKNDKLWSIYNSVKVECELNNDIVTLPIVLERMSEILEKDKKYIDSLDIYLSSLYLFVYNYDQVKEINLIDRMINDRRTKRLNDLLKKCNFDISNITISLENTILVNIPRYYDKKKIKYVSDKIKSKYMV